MTSIDHTIRYFTSYSGARLAQALIQNGSDDPETLDYPA